MSDRAARRLCLMLGLLAVVLQAATSRGYGYFRDELYYVACARHLDFGYVDHPPMVALVTAAARTLLGDSRPALRFPSALAGGATVFLAGTMAYELGGGALAIVLASVPVMFAPIFVGLFNLLSMNSFDVLFWTLAAFLVLRILRTGEERLWLPFGAVVGLALENKISVAFLVVGLVVGLALTPARRHLVSGYFWLGAALAAVLFLPNVLWEIAHGVPTAEFLRHAHDLKNDEKPPGAFLVEQVLVLNPFTLPVWLRGLWFYLFARDGRPYRAVGWTYLVVLVLMIAGGGKAYYLSGIYPMLFAAGGLVIERVARGRAVGWLAPAVIVATGLVLSPLAKPLLPVEDFIRYQHALHQDPGVAVDENIPLGQLPQFFADQFGWPELAAAVARVYDALPADDKAHACIFGHNYGEAGAIDFFGPALGLPPAISGHNSYWMWGPGRCDGKVLIVIGGTAGEVRRFYDQVVEAGRVTCKHCMPYESDLSIFVARGPAADLKALWPGLKLFI